MTMSTSVSGTTPAATLSYSASCVMSARAPESSSRSRSSRSLFIGLIETMIPPAFHVATIAITNCGTFCK